MNHQKVLLGKLFCSLLILAGCGTARHVKVRPGKGGEVAIPYANSEKSREKAVALMTQTCNGAYEIVGEGEEVIGETTTTQAKTGTTKAYGYNKHRYKNGEVQATTAQSDTTQKTEWRIKYKCR